MKKIKLTIFALILIIVILAVVITIQLTPKKMILPSDAQKLSECIPNMGEHWANPTNLPFGPIYLVDKGEVVGIEFMIHENELEKNIIQVGEEKIGKSVIMPTLNAKYDHTELNYLPEGHEGDKEPHYDVHMYLISPEEQQRLCQ